MIEPLQDPSDLETALRRGLAASEFSLVYQPKVSLSSGELAGVEALTRWRTSRFGWVEPSRFIPVAERSGLIEALTEWGLRTSARQWLQWQERGLVTNIAFNISALSLHDVGFPDRVRAMCQDEGMPAARLTLELTEGARQDAVRLMDTLTRFRIMGMQVSLDDFGTGYSSLLLLRQLPFTEVKIDKRFVDDAVHSRVSCAIIESIISLAHELGLVVTAEGVDTPEALALLRASECDLVQGYFISKPLTGGELLSFSRNLADRPLVS